ncbi:cation diffusion facilitator family transporter [Clostridium sp. SM-530-WT-3G]|uniref:cation diffusion facilitator family transporter n=1 Tax=Clostridium sp. SM-530-WT-3G TaxID=2725303 RepID=UPI00145F1FA1|nr:cation diffusion facilitator family transporter [Clostridium sp. SM-530-WT-3G]NME84191.1 cation transporter [Clostridium sp. SM-530-WT-3G]
MKTNREKQIVQISIVGIIVNLALAIVKFIIGSISGSIAIKSDAINNFTDSSSSLITIIGTKLAQKRPDTKHPFGFGRIEYITSMIIGTTIIVTGLEMIKSSIKGIIHPNIVEYNLYILLVLIITVALKTFLGIYTEKQGKNLNSGALVASGKDAKNDALISIVTIISAVIDMTTKFSVDSYAGLLISIFILKSGIEVLRDTISKILGEKIDVHIKDKIYKIVESSKYVLGAHDLILNNYGPNTYLGSINVEIDYKNTVGEVSQELHRLQMLVYKETHIYLVFGVYGVDVNSEISKEVCRILKDFKKNEPHCLGCHGVLIDEKDKKIFCDAILDFSCDREGVKSRLEKMLKDRFDKYTIAVTIDSEFD